MQRDNHLGMTSIIRDLMLDGNCYECMRAFFYSGHLLGAVGVILGKTKGLLCLPLKMNIQDGLHAAASWDGSGISSESHVGSAGDLLQFFLCFHDIYLPSKSDSITQYAEKRLRYSGGRSPFGKFPVLHLFIRRKAGNGYCFFKDFFSPESLLSGSYNNPMV